MGNKKQVMEQNSIKINGRRTRNFICLVDAYRRSDMRRNTAGRYRVGAKNEKQARKMLQNFIGFGSITIICEDNSDKISDLVPFNKCVKEIFDPETGRFTHIEE